MLVSARGKTSAVSLSIGKGSKSKTAVTSSDPSAKPRSVELCGQSASPWLNTSLQLTRSRETEHRGLPSPRCKSHNGR